MSVGDKFTMFKSDDSWSTVNTHRGYTALIEYDDEVGGYTLTITGAGAPVPAEYNTLRNAKNAFRKFLRTKPIVRHVEPEPEEE